MKPISLLATALVLAFAACKKDNKDDAAPLTPTSTSSASASGYSKLAVGNYWIYEEFTADRYENSMPTGRYDSCYVERDTMINAKMYYKMVRPTSSPLSGVSFLRDSASCTVDELGTILFSATDFTSLIHHSFLTLPPHDTIYEASSRMYPETNLNVVPAGSFHVLNFKTIYRFYGSYATPAGPFRDANARYSEGVGLVSQTLPFFLSNPNHTEIRLVRYHVN